MTSDDLLIVKTPTKNDRHHHCPLPIITVHSQSSLSTPIDTENKIMQQSMITIYVTKYWSTRGIIECRATVSGISGTYGLSARSPQFPGMVFSRNEWFDEKNEAIARVKNLAVKSIISLEKRIIKIKAVQADLETCMEKIFK